MMRATLRANSSMSAEPPLGGSDGALTVAPQSAVLAWARHGLQGLNVLTFQRLNVSRSRWTLLVTGARRIMSLSRVGSAATGAARGFGGKPHALTLPWSYWTTTARACNCLNRQQFHLEEGKWPRGVGGRAASRPGLNRA